ncbi:hypothetical protein BCR37DRAFT_376107 [Protomyces lactucae-debilis]|uniref:Uncharacterized protein n=1 Tax=Protomyces lactucae-debilis TaxID=2754530 RepID=A0A1Y2FS59_PROLT|nr:uncharacterized protein BCR37DRAFT_376107 [Protomyces lactucae-debilis]ORY86842.1 hypothetical protein BCR37DRAFT_376107 [Protomyces lactucae-debilis]
MRGQGLNEIVLRMLSVREGIDRHKASAELAELEERARQGQLPSSDAERLEELQYRRTKEATRSRLSHSSQGSRRTQTSRPKQALSNLSPNAADAQAGSSASSMTVPNALPSIQSDDSSNLHASPAIDVPGLPSSTAEQQRHDAQAVEPPLFHASVYRTGTQDVSTSEDVELGSHVNGSSSGTGRSHPGRHVQDAESVASSGKDTPDSNDAQAFQSLKRPAAALSKPSVAPTSQHDIPNEQQKMDRAKPSGIFTDPQSPPDADFSMVEGVAINGHAPLAIKALPNGHVNVEIGNKIACQSESSHVSHARQRIARLERELEQMQERLASILYEQSKKTKLIWNNSRAACQVYLMYSWKRWKPDWTLDIMYSWKRWKRGWKPDIKNLKHGCSKCLRRSCLLSPEMLALLHPSRRGMERARVFERMSPHNRHSSDMLSTCSGSSVD